MSEIKEEKVAKEISLEINDYATGLFRTKNFGVFFTDTEKDSVKKSNNKMSD